MFPSFPLDLRFLNSMHIIIYSNTMAMLLLWIQPGRLKRAARTFFRSSFYKSEVTVDQSRRLTFFYTPHTPIIVLDSNTF